MAVVDRGRGDLMEEKRCGKVATHRVVYGDGESILLCRVHYTNRDIQYMVTRKLVEQEYLENKDEKCQMIVKKREGPEEFPRANRRLLVG